jgi:hypothetical protein
LEVILPLEWEMSRHRLLNSIVVIAVIITVCVIIGMFVIRDQDSMRSRFKKIAIGMTQAEVQSILGEGKPLKKSEVPHMGRSQVVSGDEFLKWDAPGNVEIIVGFVNGLVSDKYYWEPWP